MNATAKTAPSAPLPLRSKSIAGLIALLTLRGEREFEVIFPDFDGPVELFTGTQGECAQYIAEVQPILGRSNPLRSRATGSVLISSQL